jgi:Protein of unknown function (DUF3551)
MNRILLLIGAAAAVLSLEVSPAQAAYFGNAPWCAVVNTGAGNVEWDCEYASVAACQPNVIAGNRGFCQINPYFSPPYGGPPVKRARRHRYQY